MTGAFLDWETSDTKERINRRRETKVALAPKPWYHLYAGGGADKVKWGQGKSKAKKECPGTFWPPN